MAAEKLVGRGAEAGRLLTLIELARQGSGKVVLMTGSCLGCVIM